MRTPFIAGNWKIVDRTGAVALSKAIAQATLPEALKLASAHPVWATVAETDGSPVGSEVRTCILNPMAPFTGETSGDMLVDIGCDTSSWAIASDDNFWRDRCFGQQEVDGGTRKRLIPIVCVGELLEQREAGQTQQVVQEQVEGSLAGLTPEQVAQIVIAYEPVWAIGTGKVGNMISTRGPCRPSQPARSRYNTDRLRKCGSSTEEA